MGSAQVPMEQIQVARIDRQMVAPNIHLARTTLNPKQGCSYHWHRTIRDMLYVLVGQLTVSVVMPSDRTMRGYECTGGRTETIRATPQGAQLHVLVLRPGDMIAIHPKVVHATHNQGNVPCQFFSLEGFGKLDIVEAAPI